MIEISRRYEIQGAHYLPGVPPGHKCANMHGHTWRVRVVVSGPVDQHSGMIVDFADLDALWAEAVHAHLDHRLFNDVIQNPTTEHIAPWIYAQLADEIASKGAHLVRVVVDEGTRSRATFSAD